MRKIYTIGHSNRELNTFIDLLKKFEINYFVDIRSIPKSMHVPWFNKPALARALKINKIKYQHFSSLGGLRHTNKNSINIGWHNASFRGFADYMQTQEFIIGLTELNKLIKDNKVAIMCAEAVPWRCHRSLIGDAEVIRGIKVLDIINESTLKEHQLTAFAKVNKTSNPVKIYYP